MNACYLKANNGEREALELINGRSQERRHSCVWLMHPICVRTDSQKLFSKRKKKPLSSASYGATWKQLLPGKCRFVGRSLPECVCVRPCALTCVQLHLSTKRIIATETSPGFIWQVCCASAKQHLDASGEVTAKHMHYSSKSPLRVGMPARLKISWESGVKAAKKRERRFVCRPALIPQKTQLNNSN